MNIPMKRKKLRIGVSACLIGLKYRYDGASCMQDSLVQRLRGQVDFVPVCPEFECGLGVPRPKMRLVVSPRGSRLIEIESGINHTSELTEWMTLKLEKLERLDIAAFLFKSKSPSCGWNTTKLYAPDGRVISEKGSGIFARILTRKFPNMLFGDELHMEEFMKRLSLNVYFQEHANLPDEPRSE